MKTMPNPTRRQRERVVELLRCAADVDPRCPETWLGLWGAACLMGHVRNGLPDDVVKLAWAVRATVSWPDADFRALNLEAAARIEEGWWPNG